MTTPSSRRISRNNDQLQHSSLSRVYREPAGYHTSRWKRPMKRRASLSARNCPEEDDFTSASTPDGKALLVIATRTVEGLHYEQLRLQPLGGSGLVPLDAPRGRARNASRSPDGRWFIAESDAQSFSDLLKSEPRAGMAEQRLTPVRERCFEPDVSPDGEPGWEVPGVRGGAGGRHGSVADARGW